MPILMRVKIPEAIITVLAVEQTQTNLPEV